MTLPTSYSKLRTDIKAYAEDDGTEFEDALEQIINMGHLFVARAMNLDLYTKEHGLSCTVGQNWLDLSEVKPLKVDYFVLETGKFLERRSRSYLQAYGGSGRPLFFSDRDDSSVWVAPTPTVSVTMMMTYLGRPDALSTTNETDWFTENVPDVLLKACQIEANVFLKNPEAAATLKQDLAEMLPITLREHREMVRREYQPIDAAGMSG